MTHKTLNCPTCRKRLIYVPLDGLTLHYRCDEHGLLIFKPLVQLDSIDDAVSVNSTSCQRHTSDAA
jgi:hypothetical protein